jgi:hypothetical protein
MTRRVPPAAPNSVSQHETPDDGERGSAPASPPAIDSASDLIEVISSRSPEGFGFSFKVRASGMLFRCEPARHPQQPRFWCLSIYQCLAAGAPDDSQPRWISDTFMTREDLPDVMRSVRTSMASWLADPARRDLQRWLFAQTARSPHKEMRHGEKATVP